MPINTLLLIFLLIGNEPSEAICQLVGGLVVLRTRNPGERVVPCLDTTECYLSGLRDYLGPMHAPSVFLKKANRLSDLFY